MLETNIKIVKPGPGLRLDTRLADVEAQDTSPDLLQRACSTLRSRLGLAAVVSPGGTQLLVLSREPLQRQVVQGDDWRIIVTDAGKSRRLHFSAPEERALMSQLVERAVLADVQRRTNLWTLDSPRIWYAAEPFMTLDGIAAYRRYEISTVEIDEVGVGVVVHISTAFFSEEPVSYFFRRDVPEQEREWRRRRFNFLSERQFESKGTLLYDLGEIKQKCYFSEFLRGVTCDSPSTGFRLHNKTYDSLLDYYSRKRPSARIRGDEPVARVSFQSPYGKNSASAEKPRPVPVSADRLRLRVSNNVLPKNLRDVDKLTPDERTVMIEEFWRMLGEAQFGRGQVSLPAEFWCPAEEMIGHVKPPDLLFADGRVLHAPPNGNLREHKEYYRRRRQLLDQAGCWRVPLAVNRVLYFAAPSCVPPDVMRRLAEEVVGFISRWTGKEFTYELVPYDSLEDAYERLGRVEQPGVVIFVFEDKEPATYFNVSFELKRWRIKRITLNTLRSKYTRMREAETGGGDRNQGRRAVKGWESFAEMSALDVLQQLDCVPWIITGGLNHEGHLAIDVGEDGRHFSLSLLICRTNSFEPSFWMRTSVLIKADPKQRETINKTMLSDGIVELFKHSRRRRRYDPLTSLLALRDGRLCGEELEGINMAREALVDEGILDREVRIDVVDFHKKSVKGLRLWDRGEGNRRRNVLEGTPLRLSRKRVLLANTGEATLGQGTADPVMLEVSDRTVDMGAVLSDVHAMTQLNWSNPGKAQRLPIIMKRTDDELRNRAAQEVRRLR